MTGTHALAAADPLSAPTWLTAIFTGVLGVGAIVTAVFAILAFRKQSAEVRDQAGMLRVQSDQLGVLKDQFEAQKEINQRQIAVLELQAEELRGSVAERERELEHQYRGQASRIFISQDTTRKSSDPTPYLEAIAGREATVSVTATVRNTSEQPIYGAELIWHRGSASYGEPNPQTFPVVMPQESVAGTRAYPADADLERDGAEVRFRDAAGVRWIRRRDGALDDLTP